MAVKSKMTRNSAKQLIGQPVYIELKNGRSYVGWVTGAESGQLILSGQSPRKTKMISNKRVRKARVSSFIPGMLGTMVGSGSMFGGNMIPGAGGIGGGSAAGGIGGGFGGLGSIMGLMGRAFPIMKMGFGMIRTIMPILKMFKG
ncbi:hypothetical protein [Paenibacillus terrigena]|uniref:hypothetical protein n=1 Tax=Paenibacillus terrigena TaxID=369333 RepID=UPI0028D674FB|nr:hypothetical protein [Paenibacillus terrigena]